MVIPSNTHQNFELGTLKIDPTMKDLTIEQALEKANAYFNVRLVNTTYKDYLSGHEIQSKNHSVIREDTMEELGFGFTDNYTPVNYHDALGAIYGDMKKLGNIPTRVVNFNNGGKIAIQFVLPEQYFVADCEHKLFQNLYSSHNGTMGIVFNSSDVRIVCGNTFRKSLADSTMKMQARHTSNVLMKLEKLAEMVGLVKQNAHEYYNQLNQFALQKAQADQISNFLNALFPKDENLKTAHRDNNRQELNEAIELSVKERNSGEITFYDLLQGTTRLVSHKTQKRNPDEQFEYANAGTGDKLNQKAYNWLLENA